MIKFTNVKEGDIYPSDCLICLGKNIVGQKTWGYYIMVNNPIKTTKPHVDPNTFEAKIGPVTSKYILRWSSNQKKFFIIKAIVPVN